MPRYIHTYTSTISFQFSHIKITSDPSPVSNLPLSVCTEPQSENFPQQRQVNGWHGASALTCPRHPPHVSCFYEEAGDHQRTHPAVNPSHCDRAMSQRARCSGGFLTYAGLPLVFLALSRARSILPTPVTSLVLLRSTS